MTMLVIIGTTMQLRDCAIMVLLIRLVTYSLLVWLNSILRR